MKKKSKKEFGIAAGLLLTFALWTVLLCWVDVKPIGPRGSAVGFSTLNGAFHTVTGANMTLYTVTDWLGLVPIATALAFGVLGLVQWIRRKSFWQVDRSILALGGFYLVVMGGYVLFEFVVINRRPVLIEGYLEASYLLTINNQSALRYVWFENFACMALGERNIVAIHFAFSRYFTDSHLISPLPY